MTIEPVIWIEVAQGSKNAYSQLYRFLFSRLYNYGAKFTSDSVLLEDSVQETLLLLWHKRHIIQEVRYPETYFFSAFRNILITRLRRENLESEASLPTADADFSLVEIIIKNEENLELDERLKASMEKLTAHQKEVIYLRFYEGFSYDKVASVLGITTKATYKAVARALERLERNMLIRTLIIIPFFTL